MDAVYENTSQSFLELKLKLFRSTEMAVSSTLTVQDRLYLRKTVMAIRLETLFKL